MVVVVTRVKSLPEDKVGISFIQTQNGIFISNISNGIFFDTELKSGMKLMKVNDLTVKDGMDLAVISEVLSKAPKEVKIEAKFLSKSHEAYSPTAHYIGNIEENKSFPPSYHKIDRGNKDEKVCRICLDSDAPDDMIAPCQCRGGSRWVHRYCLDEWRIHETDRAFSKCTECLFEYHLKLIGTNTRRRRAKYCIMVTRDMCCATLGIQAGIILLALIASAVDYDRTIPKYINPEHAVGVYYVVGFLAFLMLLGIFGTVIVCINGGSIEQSLQSYPRMQFIRRGNQQSYTDRSMHYQTRRRTHTNNTRAIDNCCHSFAYSPSPHNYHDPCCIDSCCWCCGAETRAISSRNEVGGNTSCDCDLCGNNGGNECGEIILIFVVVLAIFLAIAGFTMGVFVVVIIFQRSVQRHAYLIRKQQLTDEFQVVDLSGYDVEQPSIDSPTNIDLPIGPVPSAPKLPEEDEIYLKKMGLMS